MMENSTLRCQTYFLTMPYERRMIQLRWTASLEHAKKLGLTALKHLNKTSFTASTWKAIPRVPFPRERAKSDDNEFSLTSFAQSMSKAKSGLNHLETLCNLDRATQFTIVPSHHRVWVDGAMTMARWFDDDDAMVWRCAMATVRWHDYADAIELWQWSNALSRHRHRTIVIASLHHRAIDFFALFL